MNAEIAAATKARAMFGKRLKDADYMHLLEQKSIPELAYALHRQTRFGETMRGINESAIHRGQLESLVRRDLYIRFDRLMKYCSQETAQFVYASVMNHETEQILLALRATVSQDEDERNDLIAQLPTYSESYTSFDFKKLASARDYDGLLDVLKGTVYEPVIRQFHAEEENKLDFIGLEHALQQKVYDRMLSIIEKHSRGEEKRKLLMISLTRAELDSISNIYRLKKYFNASAEQIRASVNSYTNLFTKSEMDSLAEDCSADEIVDRLKKKYHSYIGNRPFRDIEHLSEEIQYNMSYHFIETSTEPRVVLICYLILSEIEIVNVIDIIEGVRYHISAQEIHDLLLD